MVIFLYFLCKIPWFIMLCLGPMEMNHVMSELCYKGLILQRNNRKMTIHGHFPIIPLKNSWSFSYNSFVKFMVIFL